jgi:hypothetical protein
MIALDDEINDYTGRQLRRIKLNDLDAYIAWSRLQPDPRAAFPLSSDVEQSLPPNSSHLSRAARYEYFLQLVP